MRGGSKVVTDRPDPRGADAFGLVLRFERRRGGKVLLHAPASPANRAPANRASLKPVYRSEPADNDTDDFARFEQEPEERINYRQRMFMNVIALAIVGVPASAAGLTGVAGAAGAASGLAASPFAGAAPFSWLPGVLA